MSTHTILFLAANPAGSNSLALDLEAHAIQAELERAGHRDQFAFVTRWAVEPMDLLRELRKLRPTVVHFSGHGEPASGTARTAGAHRDAVTGFGGHEHHDSGGLYFQAAGGRAQLVSAAAIEQTFGAAGASVRLVVLNACYSAAQADALLAHVDCVVGMSGAMDDAAARHFAAGFYGGLGEREPVAAAYQQGKAAIALGGVGDAEMPQLRVRVGVDADRVVFAGDASRQPTAIGRDLEQGRPLLDIWYSQDRGWMVRNLGGAPAVRGVVFESVDPDRDSTAIWEHPIRVAALNKGEVRSLRWLANRNVGRIGIVYEAADGTQYSAICHHDNCRDLPGNMFPVWPDRDIGREWDV